MAVVDGGGGGNGYGHGVVCKAIDMSILFRA